MRRGLIGTWTIFAALLLLALCATSCGGADAAGTELQPSVSVHDASPDFPLDEPYFSRRVNAVETLDGLASFSDSDAPGFTEHASLPGVATLSSAEQPTAWAIYRFPLNATVDLESIRVNLVQSGFNKYWVLLADYNSGRWQTVGEKTGTSQVADFGNMRLDSPGNFCYMALLVTGGNVINISSLEQTTNVGGGNEDPIYDDFEDNDVLTECTPINTGSYIASIHDTYVPEMVVKGEGFDRWDFYCVDLVAGQHFTATMEYEYENHFMEQGSHFFNDLDVLMYAPGVVSDPLNTFDEQWSSYRIYFTNIELVHFVAPSTGTYRMGIRGDFADGAFSDAEYVLQSFKSSNTYQVSGTISQNGQEADKKFLVVLTPGNFSAVTSLEASPHGQYVIQGVPDGTYTLEVRGSAAWDQHYHTYPNTLEVVVNGGSATANLDIDPFPGV